MIEAIALADLKAFDPDYRERGEEMAFLCIFDACNGKRRRTLYASTSGLYLCQRCGEKGLLTEFRKVRGRRANSARAALSAFD
jgi:hypothetical protein